MQAASPTAKMLTGLALLGLLGGAWGIIEALMYGTHATGLGSFVPWGLGVALYLTFLGFSAGGLPLALATTVFGKHEYEELSGLVAWTVVVTELCAGLAIVLDLGHMERMYRFMTAPSFTSPMAWIAAALGLRTASNAAKACSSVALPSSACHSSAASAHAASPRRPSTRRSRRHAPPASSPTPTS